MALSIDDSAILAQLHTDIKAAWNTLTIRDDPPFVPMSKGDMPRAFCILQDISPTRGGGTAGSAQVSMLFTYQITGQFVWPTTGTLEAAKKASAQALISLLTANLVYASQYRRDVTGIRWDYQNDRAGNETQEPYYEVAIDFAVEIVGTP